MNTSDLTEKIKLLPIILPVLVISIVLHELAHGYSALALGDNTAKEQGHLTLNPVKHFTPAAVIVFILTFVALPFPWVWAYTPINPRKFKHERRDMALVSAAGPLVNFVIAFLGILVFFGPHPVAPLFLLTHPYWYNAVTFAIGINVFLGIFNLLPIPPLDGSKIIGIIMPKQMYQDWRRLDQYASLIFIAFIVLAQGQLYSVVNSGVTHTERFMQKVADG